MFKNKGLFMGDYSNKDPEDWKTGKDPATEKQRKALYAISQKKGLKFDIESMTKAEASKVIELYSPKGSDL